MPVRISWSQNRRRIEGPKFPFLGIFLPFLAIKGQFLEILGGSQVVPAVSGGPTWFQLVSESAGARSPPWIQPPSSASARRAEQTGRGGRLPLTRRRRNVLRVVLAGGERKIVVVSSAGAPQPDF